MVVGASVGCGASVGDAVGGCAAGHSTADFKARRVIDGGLDSQYGTSLVVILIEFSSTRCFTLMPS